MLGAYTARIFMGELDGHSRVRLRALLGIGAAMSVGGSFIMWVLMMIDTLPAQVWLGSKECSSMKRGYLKSRKAARGVST